MPLIVEIFSGGAFTWNPPVGIIGQVTVEVLAGGGGHTGDIGIVSGNSGGGGGGYARANFFATEPEYSGFAGAGGSAGNFGDSSNFQESGSDSQIALASGGANATGSGATTDPGIGGSGLVGDILYGGGGGGRGSGILDDGGGGGGGAGGATGNGSDGGSNSGAIGGSGGGGNAPGGNGGDGANGQNPGPDPPQRFPPGAGGGAGGESGDNGGDGFCNLYYYLGDVAGTIDVTAPPPTGQAAGTTTPPVSTGSLDGTAPIPVVDIGGGVTQPVISGSLDGTAPISTGDLGGVVTLPPGTGTLDAVAPAAPSAQMCAIAYSLPPGWVSTNACTCCPGTSPPTCPPGDNTIQTCCCTEPIPKTLTATIVIPGNAWDGVTITLYYQGYVNPGGPPFDEYHLWLGSNNADPCGTATAAPGIQARLECHCGLVHSGELLFGMIPNTVGQICAPSNGGEPPFGGGSCFPFDQSFGGILMSGGAPFCNGAQPGCTSGAVTGHVQVTA